MKKIGFMGAYDKANFIIYTAKVFKNLNYKILVVDTSSIQKIKYIVPSVNPTKAYITNFEGIDFAVGFTNWEEIERYLGIKFATNEDGEQSKEEANQLRQQYDYVLIDIDSSEKLESFEMQDSYKNYFVTSFDMFSLKKGMSIFQNLKTPIQLTRILFTYEISKEDEDYLNYISLEYKIKWSDYAIYFQILGDDNKIFEENQRLEKIRFKRLSLNYKDSIAYVVQDINSEESLAKIKRTMKD